MSSTVGMLDEGRLRRLLDGDPFVRRVEVVEVCASTNDEIRKRSLEGAPSGTVVLADRQTAGRGRMGRRWFSPPGLGLYMSALIRPSGPVGAVTLWTLASALAACEACREMTGGVTIKWPNDLYHGGRKLAGTLTELRTAGPCVQELIVGTGFNVNHRESDFPPPLATRATSLLQARGGMDVDRELLATGYLGRLGQRFATLERGGGDEILDAWSRLAPGTAGERVRITQEGAAYFEGITRGLDSSGALRVEREDRRIVSVHLGESVTSLEG